jgi:multicomponent Na+:H+ antiporter subunit C
MSLLVALTVGVLAAAGCYLLLSRDLQRVVIGFVVFANAVNLLILGATPAPPGARPPLVDGVDPATVADPLPQAFVLTAIVIGLGLTAYLVALVARLHADGGAVAEEERP